MSRISLILMTLSVMTLSTGVEGATPLPKKDIFTQICDEIFAQFVRSTAGAKPKGQFSFADALSRFQKDTHRSPRSFEDAPYLEKARLELLRMGDLSIHSRPLDFPPSIQHLELLESALRNGITDAKLLSQMKKQRNSSTRMALDWVRSLATHPKIKDNPQFLLQNLVFLKKTRRWANQGAEFPSGIPIIPEVESGRVRLFKGTNFTESPQRSLSQVNLPPSEVKDGSIHFLTQEEARQHSVRAEAFHPDGVSVSRDESIVQFFGTHMKIYDVPQDVFEKLPRGALELDEYVFKYSIPEAYRVLTLPKEVFRLSRALDERSKNLLIQYLRARGPFSDPSVLLHRLKLDLKPIRTRKGQTLSISGIFSDRLDLHEGFTLENHVLRGHEILSDSVRKGGLSQVSVPPSIRLEKTLEFAHFFHDSGKPLATRLGETWNHHDLSVEIVLDAMEQAGFTPSEKQLAKVLIQNDVIGQVIQGNITPQQGYEQILKLSAKTVLEPKDFFQVQKLLYTADAGSYPDVRATVFRNSSNGLVIQSEKFKVLQQLLKMN